MSRTVGVSAAAAGNACSHYRANDLARVDTSKRTPGLGGGFGAERFPPDHSEGSRVMIPNYGAAKTTNGTRSDRHAAEAEAEEESLSEDDLEGEGASGLLTPSSYRRQFRLYSFVPIMAVFTILFFTLLHFSLWPNQGKSPSLGTHMAVATIGAAVWTVSFALRIPLYLLSTNICHCIPASTPFVSVVFRVFVEESLRLTSLILAKIHVQKHVAWEDPAFSLVWTLSLGWVAAEVIISVSQGYAQLSLYTDLVNKTNYAPIQPIRPSLLDELEGEVNPTHALDQLEHEANQGVKVVFDRILRARARAELESLYGIPVVEIPVFVSCLLRIDSIMLSIALFLIVAASYLSSPHPSQAIYDTIPTFLLVCLFHTILAFGWTPHILPRIGLHVASYVSCVMALGMLFVGLARWDAI